MESGQGNQTNQATNTSYASFGRANLVRTELKDTKMEGDSVNGLREQRNSVHMRSVLTDWLYEKSLSLGTLSLRAKKHLTK